MNRLNRRTLLTRLGAAVVAAPALAITATRPADAAAEEAQAALYQRGYDVATSRAESRARDEYQRGLERGLQATVHQWLDIEYLERRTVAEIDGRYVAAATPLVKLPDR